MKRWEVFHREEKEDATLLVIGVDDLSMASLIKTKGIAIRFKVNIGLGEKAKSHSE